MLTWIQAVEALQKAVQYLDSSAIEVLRQNGYHIPGCDHSNTNNDKDEDGDDDYMRILVVPNSVISVATMSDDEIEFQRRRKEKLRLIDDLQPKPHPSSYDHKTMTLIKLPPTLPLSGITTTTTVLNEPKEVHEEQVRQFKVHFNKEITLNARRNSPNNNDEQNVPPSQVEELSCIARAHSTDEKIRRLQAFMPLVAKYGSTEAIAKAKKQLGMFRESGNFLGCSLDNVNNLTSRLEFQDDPTEAQKELYLRLILQLLVCMEYHRGSTWCHGYDMDSKARDMLLKTHNLHNYPLQASYIGYLHNKGYSFREEDRRTAIDIMKRFPANGYSMGYACSLFRTYINEQGNIKNPNSSLVQFIEQELLPTTIDSNRVFGVKRSMAIRGTDGNNDDSGEDKEFLELAFHQSSMLLLELGLKLISMDEPKSPRLIGNGCSAIQEFLASYRDVEYVGHGSSVTGNNYSTNIVPIPSAWLVQLIRKRLLPLIVDIYDEYRCMTKNATEHGFRDVDDSNSNSNNSGNNSNGDNNAPIPTGDGHNNGDCIEAALLESKTLLASLVMKLFSLEGSHVLMSSWEASTVPREYYFI